MRYKCNLCGKRFFIVITYMEDDGDLTFCKYCALKHEDEVMGNEKIKNLYREAILASYSGGSPGV